MKKIGIISIAVAALLGLAAQRYGNTEALSLSPSPADDLAIDLKTEDPATVVQSFLTAVKSGAADSARALTSLAPPGFRDDCLTGARAAKTAAETVFERELDRKLYDLLGSTAEYLRVSRPDIGSVALERLHGAEAVVAVSAIVGGNSRTMTFYLSARGAGWAIFHIDAVPVNEPASAAFARPRQPCAPG
jgi:hypothetical protein